MPSLPRLKENLLNQIRKRLTYANVMSSIAVFLVLGGGAAYAAFKVPPKSVGTPQLKRNAVKTGKVAFEAIRAGKLSKNAVPTNRLRDNAVAADKIANGSVLTDKLADESVATGKIAGEAVDTGKIAPNAVDAGRLADGAVNALKLGSITIRTNTVTVAKETRDVVAQSCEGNERMISGGGGFDIVTAEPHPQVIMSMAQGANTWRVRGFNPSAAFDRTMTVRVFCLDG